MILRDYTGVEIAVGSRVVFNKSGNVKFGIVRELKHTNNHMKWVSEHEKKLFDIKSDDYVTSRHGHMSGDKYVRFPYIMIEADDTPGQVSKVRYPDSVVVIE